MSNEEQQTGITDSRKKAIKKKAWELFDLIEDTCDQYYCDNTTEMLAEELKDLLLDHHGFNELWWAFKMAQPKSKEASWSLEEVLHSLKQDELRNLFDLAKSGSYIADMFLDDKKSVKENSYAITSRLKRLRKQSKMLLEEVNSQYYSRAIEYKKEIENLKEAS